MAEKIPQIKPLRMATPSLAPRKISQDDRFFLIAQSSASNSLAHKLTSRIADPAELDLFGNATVASKDFRLFIRGYTELTNGVNTSASKLLDSLLITATVAGLRDTLVELPLKTYMHMRGLKDVKETRKQVKRDIDALGRVRFEYRGVGKESGSWLNVSLYGGTSGIKNGIIYFRFNEDFYNSIRIGDSKFLFMFFPKESLRLNDNANPYSYSFSRRISEHKRMNLGHSNENKIRVKTLLDACPHFPTYEEVMAGNRNVSDRIITPFERDMDALSSVYVWHYQGDQPVTYQDFIEAVIVVEWAHYPDTKLLVKRRGQ